MSHPPSRFASAYADLLIRRPLLVLLVLGVVGAAATYATTRLTIEPNQLDLISQDLQEVKDVKRVVDMVGGAGHLMLALRSEDDQQLKRVSDDLAAMLNADRTHVRAVTYKLPVEFVQKNMVLFVKTEDLLEGKKRIDAYLKDQLRRNNPFFIEIRKTEPVKLDLDDLVAKYSSMGKKSILDDYYISQDRKMLLVLIKPMWNSTELQKTHAYLKKLEGDLAAYSQANRHGVKLVHDYDLMGKTGTIAYGFTGAYKTALDDSYAIEASLHPVSILAFVLIFAITWAFFRRIVPSLIVITGMVLGTVLTMGFTKATVGELNMITSILGGLLMGFGVDYGLHFIFRTRIELGAGKPYDEAIREAVINAGRPALVSAVVTAGSFFVLLVSGFRGFSQFGFLAGCGTLIIGFTLFAWSPAILSALGRRWPELPKRLIGEMPPPKDRTADGEIHIPHPRLVLALCTVVVVATCAFAIPWTSVDFPRDHKLSLADRFKAGVRFDYNTRALMPANQPSIKLQDELNERFQISADPIAVATDTLEQAKEVYEELSRHPEKYPTVDQVVSLYSFVPPKETAEANAKILETWQKELEVIEISALPPEIQDKAAKFKELLSARPFGVEEVPEVYRSQFRSLETTLPENQGYLTYIYPAIDLWDGKKMLAFADQTKLIRTEKGTEYRAAGLPILYATLARIVLWDGKVTVILTALWILLMHYLDFRSVKLALASVIPLCVGLVVMLGIMAMTDIRLNFMNIVMLPILLGFGVSHGLYLLHRFIEGTSPVVALKSVGAAVASSTLTTVAGFAALFVASHNGLKSMGLVACLGLLTTLLVSFTVLAAVMQLLYNQRRARSAKPDKPRSERAAA